MSIMRAAAILSAVLAGALALFAAQRAGRIDANLLDEPRDPSIPGSAASADQRRDSIRFMADSQPVQEFTVVDIDGRPISSADLR